MHYHIRQASVAVFILVLCASLCSSLPRHKGEVKPPDPFLFEGETLNLSCRLVNKSNENITLYFKYQPRSSRDNNCSKQNKSDQNKRNLTEFTIRTNESHIDLVVPNVSISDGGEYCCVGHPNDSCYDRIAKQIVTVEHDLKKVTNFRCIVQDWIEKMHCTWKHNVKYLCPDLVKVNLTYRSPHEPTPTRCPSQVNSSCFWNQHNFITNNYTMILAVRHERRGNRTEESNFTIYTWHHVKPNRVKNLTVEPLNSTCVKLHWHSNTERNRSDLKFSINYSTSDNWQKVTESLNFKDNFVSTTQCQLQPYTNYTFRVWVRPITKGYRSEPEEAHNQTLEDLPTASPETCPGCFHQFECPGTMSQRCVTVYWRDIPEDHKHGHITYVVQLNDFETLNTTETCITFRGVNTTSRDSRAVITPSTKAGKALKNTTVLMFHERPDPPEDLVVEVSDKLPKEYFISWKDSKRSTESERNITIVWCYRYGRSDDTECGTQINWIDVATPALNYTLSPDANTSHPIGSLDIRIGISSTVRYAGGAERRSSGIQWSTCIYNYDQRFISCIVMRGQKKKNPVTSSKLSTYISLNQRPSTAPILLPAEGTTVSWEIEPCPNAYITGYSITHCQTSDERTCKGLNYSVRVGNSVKKYHIQDISLDTKYLVYIEAWSRKGSSLSSNSSQPRPRNTTIIHLHAIHTGDYSVYSILGVLAFLILVALAILGIWRCYKSKMKFAAMNKAESDVMATTDTVGSRHNPVQDVNKTTRLDFLKMLKNCCSPRVKNQSKNGSSFKSSDSETPLLDGGVKTTENNASQPMHSKDDFNTSNVFTGNKRPALDKEENVALLNEILENGQSHPMSTEGSILNITQDVTKLVDIDKMLVEHKSQGEDIDRLHAGDGKEMSGMPQTTCAHPLLRSCQTRGASNKSNELYMRVSDVSAAGGHDVTAVSGRDVRHTMKMIGDNGHDRHSHVSAIADSGHDIQSYVQITDDGGHGTHSHVSAIADSGHDIHSHVSAIADSGHDIHSHVSAIADSGHDIQSYVQITEDSGHDTHSNVSAIADSGNDIQSYVQITVDSGHDTHRHVSAIADSQHDTQNHVSAIKDSRHDTHNHVSAIGDSGHDIINNMSAIADSRQDSHNHVSNTEDSGQETQDSDTSNEYSQRTIEDNANRVSMTTEKELQNISPRYGFIESSKDTSGTTSASRVALKGHLEYVRFNTLGSSNT